MTACIGAVAYTSPETPAIAKVSPCIEGKGGANGKCMPRGYGGIFYNNPEARASAESGPMKKMKTAVATARA